MHLPAFAQGTFLQVIEETGTLKRLSVSVHDDGSRRLRVLIEQRNAAGERVLHFEVETIQSLLFLAFIRLNHLENVSEYVCLLLVRDSDQLAQPAGGDELRPEDNLRKLLGVLLLLDYFVNLFLHFFGRILVVFWRELLFLCNADQLWNFYIVVLVCKLVDKRGKVVQVKRMRVQIHSLDV